MDQPAAPSIDSRIFTDNLAALRQVDPPLADRINQAHSATLGAVPAWTRDGQLNFRIPSNGGGSTWFGRTSIPRVRAEALLERFDTGTGNVLLPGIGQGMAARLLLDRLGAHRAVFVWETHPEAVALAMRLHGWSEAITSERLEWLVCPPGALTDTLADWFDRHPGHLCPERIMMWPWATSAELAACRNAVQRAYERIGRLRSEHLARERAEFATAVQSSGEGVQSDDAFTRGPVAFISLQPREDVWVLSEAMLTGAQADGVPAVASRVRGPADLHPLGRLRSLRADCDAPPAAAVLLDGTRDQAADLCPASMPVLSWVGPAMTGLPGRLAGLSERDGLVATSSRVAERLQEAGWTRGQVPVVPYPCVAELPEAEPINEDRPIDVLLVADLGPTEPDPFGYSLPTHTQLWRTVRDLIQARIETFAEDDGPELFRRAEEKCGFRLEESALRWAMLEQLTTTVADTLLASFMAKALVDAGIAVTVAGQGWSTSSAANQQVIPSRLGDLRQTFLRTKLFIWANATGDVSLLPLLAAGLGAAIVARAHPRDTQPGGLATLFTPGTEMVPCRSVRDLVAAARQLLDQPEKRGRLVSGARKRCRTEHLPQHRLAALKIAASSYFPTTAKQS